MCISALVRTDRLALSSTVLETVVLLYKLSRDSLRNDTSLLLIKQKIICLIYIMVAGRIIEILSLAKETNMLPLHQPAMYKYIIRLSPYK